MSHFPSAQQQQQTISSPSFPFPSPHSIVTSCDHDAHPLSDVTFPFSSRAAPLLAAAHVRACTRTHALLIDTRPQPPPSYERVPPTKPTPAGPSRARLYKLQVIRSGKHGMVKPRLWPPSGTHPPPVSPKRRAGEGGASAAAKKASASSAARRLHYP